MIAFTALHPLALITAEVYHWFKERRGGVSLAGDDERLYRPRSEQERRRREPENGPREINADNTWE